MFRELLASCLAPASRYARRHGYVYETVAIEARYRRCRAAWTGHLTHCHRVIRAACDVCPGRGLAVVLGSGPLFDIPLEDLADAFAEVVLVDVFHPARARRRAAALANVRLFEHDLLGFDAGLDWSGTAAATGRWRQTLPAADLVVSANLLSQLPLQPAAHFGSPAPEATRKLLQGHVDDLAGGTGTACLITEWRRRRFDRQGQLLSTEQPLSGVVLPPPGAQWEWHIAPPGELAGGGSLILDVAHYVF
ncbi:MAG TPA: hypothetical protein HPQ04_13625 [Rhodospirillaceae bacterium]|nr:hypothetical protein [Rhodospirillaceae bacterium]